MRRTFSAIAAMVGIPDVPPMQEKYLVRQIDMSGLPEHQRLDIEQIYLRTKEKGAEIRIRRRGQDGMSFYFLARTRKAGDNRPVEEEELVPEQEYTSLMRLKDRGTQVLSKDRICFLWNNKYFEVDVYNGKHKGLVVLLAESPGPGSNGFSDFPPFITIGKRITDDPRYSDRNLAKRK